MVVVTVSVLAGFTSFDLVWVMGRDYPNRSTLTLAVNQYWRSFRAGYWAYGAAIRGDPRHHRPQHLVGAGLAPATPRPPLGPR